MPCYDYKCQCGKQQERFFAIADKPDTVPCECGKDATKQLSIGGIQGDEMPVWMRHHEVLGCLQPKGERPIQTRGEYKQYLKKRGIEEL